MNRCCLTCELFRCGECNCNEMKYNLEDVLDIIVGDMKEGITNQMVLRVIDIVGDEILDRCEEMNFIPPNHEFYCKYYE